MRALQPQLQATAAQQPGGQRTFLARPRPICTSAPSPPARPRGRRHAQNKCKCCFARCDALLRSRAAQCHASTLLQAPPNVRLPASPALDVRNDAVFYRDLICLGDMRGRVVELSDQRYKTQAGSTACRRAPMLHEKGSRAVSIPSWLSPPLCPLACRQVTALAGSLHLISRLQVREFCWVGDHTGQRVAGFLAQEVLKVLPQVS